MTYAEAKEFVQEHPDNAELDQEDIEAAFTALYDRAPDYKDREDGLWSACCLMALDM